MNTQNKIALITEQSYFLKRRTYNFTFFSVYFDEFTDTHMHNKHRDFETKLRFIVYDIWGTKIFAIAIGIMILHACEMLDDY